MIDEVNMFPELISELLSRGRSVRFQAPGRSMYPTIREGETITVEPILPKDVCKGDIILYGTEGHVIAHRVVGIEQSGDVPPRFALRDDTWGVRDERVEAGEILGRVVSVERGGRTLSLNTARSRIRLAIHRVGSRLKRLFSRILAPS